LTEGDATSWLDIVGINFHCYTSHDRVQGKDYAEVVLLAYQNTFHASHHSSHNADSLAHNQVRMRFNLPLAETGA
jgi:hypothetical protein